MSDTSDTSDTSDIADAAAGATGRTGSGRGSILAAGGAVAALAVVGGAAWAATSFFGQGEQPATVLPDETVAYAAVDLDPSGGQKLEALDLLRKFPAFEEGIGLDTDDDVLEELVSEFLAEGGCEGVEYAADVEPWLGSRLAVAGVDTGAEDGVPVPVAVLQVSDAGAAEEGLAAVRDACAGEEVGWVVEGDWAVLAPDDEAAATVVDLADDGTLAEDEDFLRWTDEAGGPGIATMYAAPEAGALLLRSMDELGGLAPEASGMTGMSSDVPPEVSGALEDFEGAAAVLRFDDGGVELELAAGAGDQTAALGASEAGAGVVETLPADTAVALGLGFADGWLEAMLDRAAASSDGAVTADQLATDLEQMLGVAPEQLEALFGDSAALAVGPQFSVESFFASSGPESLPVGAKVAGDTEEIQAALESLRPALGPMAALLEATAADGAVAISPNDDYRAELAQDGGLGETATFDEVVDDAGEAAAVLYVDFDAGDGGWLAGLAGEDAELQENLEPLSAFAVTASLDGDVSRAVVRLTTD